MGYQSVAVGLLLIPNQTQTSDHTKYCTRLVKLYQTCMMYIHFRDQRRTPDHTLIIHFLSKCTKSVQWLYTFGSDCILLTKTIQPLYTFHTFWPKLYNKCTIRCVRNFVKPTWFGTTTQHIFYCFANVLSSVNSFICVCLAYSRFKPDNMGTRCNSLFRFRVHVWSPERSREWQLVVR